ncbi:MAG: LacI family DNA-binding transcriptional regulator [Phycisphaerae bacterium]|nr:LacI family DNA-binding transcriptional regulator [Phycisphaerae bacterium]
MAKRKAISIRDVARESQASLTTVSLVLNQRARRISRATQDRVLETASRLGYRPSRLAQGLQAQRSGFLAILVPQLRHAFADAYFGELISAIHDYASDANWKILLEVAHPAFIKVNEHLELFDRHFVDGILCLGVTDKDTWLRDFAGGHRPMVVVNNYLPDHGLNHVRCDYYRGGQLAARHLLDLGHRHIGMIRGASEVQTTWDLRRGLEETLTEAGLSLPDVRTEDGLYTEEGGAAAAIALLKRAPQLTALLAGNDKMAIGAISGLKEAGHHVPREVSVLGCDDMHQAAFCDPPLTTVHTPIYEVGQRACQRLLDLIEGNVEHVAETLPVSLTVRKSASSPKESDEPR